MQVYANCYSAWQAQWLTEWAGVSDFNQTCKHATRANAMATMSIPAVPSGVMCSALGKVTKRRLDSLTRGCPLRAFTVARLCTRCICSGTQLQQETVSTQQQHQESIC